MLQNHEFGNTLIVGIFNYSSISLFDDLFSFMPFSRQSIFNSRLPISRNSAMRLFCASRGTDLPLSQWLTDNGDTSSNFAYPARFSPSLVRHAMIRSGVTRTDLSLSSLLLSVDFAGDSGAAVRFFSRVLILFLSSETVLRSSGLHIHPWNDLQYRPFLRRFSSLHQLQPVRRIP